MGLSGLPSILMILLSRTATSWQQPTAQYGKTLLTSLTLAMRKRRVSAWAARRSRPRPNRPPSEKPAEVRRKSRRLGALGGAGIVASPERGDVPPAPWRRRE